MNDGLVWFIAFAVLVVFIVGNILGFGDSMPTHTVVYNHEDIVGFITVKAFEKNWGPGGFVSRNNPHYQVILMDYNEHADRYSSMQLELEDQDE